MDDIGRLGMEWPGIDGLALLETWGLTHLIVFFHIFSEFFIKLFDACKKLAQNMGSADNPAQESETNRKKKTTPTPTFRKPRHGLYKTGAWGPARPPP